MTRSRLVLAVYGAAALWLVVFVAYLVYLLLPFGVGLLSTLFAASVALALLGWLLWWLVWRPLRHQAVSRWGFAAVLALAVGTLTLDAGWTHYLIPFPPSDQDECTFGSIGAQEFHALVAEMAAKFEPDWAAASQSPSAKEALEQQITALVPNQTGEDEMIASIHALARAVGAEFEGGGLYQADTASYRYKFDLNKSLALRRVLFRWAEIQFNVVRSDVGSGQARLEKVLTSFPSVTGRSQTPPRDRSCPPLPSQ